MRAGLVLSAAIVVAGSLSAEAAGTACQPLRLTGGDKGVTVVDNPPAGKSPGDTRAGWRRLVDEAGAPAGEVHYVATLTEPAANGRGDVLAGQYFITLPDGLVVASTLYELGDAANTGKGAGNAVLVVTGGTGAYAGASGAVTIEAGDRPHYAFALACR